MPKRSVNPFVHHTTSEEAAETMKKAKKSMGQFLPPVIERISESLWHEKVIDIGIEQDLRFFRDYLSIERRDEIVERMGLLSTPKIFEVHRLAVSNLSRVPNFIFSEFADATIINFHIGVKDYLSRGPLSRSTGGFAEGLGVRCFEFKQPLFIPPLQNFHVGLQHLPIRFDIEPFKVRVLLDGFLGREVM